MTDVGDVNDIDGDDLDEGDDRDDDVDANTIPAATARDVCEYLVKAVVEEPDGVEVDVNDRGGRGTTIEVRAASSASADESRSRSGLWCGLRRYATARPSTSTSSSKSHVGSGPDRKGPRVAG